MLKQKMKKYLLLLLISFQGLLAQVQFEAKVSKSTLGLNERLRIDFTMNADGDNFSPPSFEGFRIVGGPFQQMSQQWVNGRGSFSKTYSYILIPTQKGVLTIRQASVEIDGQIYKTSPLKITVTNAVELPKDPNDTSVSAADAIHLIAEISKTNPYINEPITVVYKLYFSEQIGITNWKELDKPKFVDFWSQNIDIKQLVAEEAVFKGERVRSVVLRKTVLYPQKSGKLVIEPLTLDIDLQLPTNRRNFFGQVILTEGHKTVSAGATTIHVKPLPLKGKPENFTGAVGKFDFKVIPSKTTLQNGESLDLIVKLTGKGNLKLFDLPKPVVPTALEMYDPVHSEQVNTPLAGMTGSISDKYAIIPQFKGDYVIKPIRFSYFDLGTGTYRTITSDEITIKVLESVNADEVPSLPEINKKEIVSNDHFQYIKLSTDLKNIDEKDFLGSTLFYALLSLPFLCIPFVVLFKKKKEAIDRDMAGNKIKLSNKLAKKYLSDAKKQIENKESFYVALEKALHNFLKAKLKIETSEMSKEKINENLLSRKATPETIQSFLLLIENCELARYAPSLSGNTQTDFDKAVTLISELEKQLV